MKRVVWVQELHGGLENFLEMDVDCSSCAMEVHIRIEIQSCVQKHLQGWKPRLVNRESMGGKKSVVQEPFNIHRANGYPAHIGIS